MASPILLNSPIMQSPCSPLKIHKLTSCVNTAEYINYGSNVLTPMPAAAQIMAKQRHSALYILKSLGAAGARFISLPHFSISLCFL